MSKSGFIFCLIIIICLAGTVSCSRQHDPLEGIWSGPMAGDWMTIAFIGDKCFFDVHFILFLADEYTFEENAGTIITSTNLETMNFELHENTMIVTANDETWTLEKELKHQTPSRLSGLWTGENGFMAFINERLYGFIDGAAGTTTYSLHRNRGTFDQSSTTFTFRRNTLFLHAADGSTMVFSRQR